MDSLITAAARALSIGDPLAALKRIALRNDAHALALRGIAMAQLGDFELAILLLRRARRAFGANEAVAYARCVIAEAEIALVTRDLGWPVKLLETARITLVEHGDQHNAIHARYLGLRRLLLTGDIKTAERVLNSLDLAQLPPTSRTVHELVAAGIALRRLQAQTLRAALSRAEHAASEARIPALLAEVNCASQVLTTPAARLIDRGEERLLLLDEVESLLGSEALVVDACRNTVRQRDRVISLARRPVLFALARELAAAWPDEVPRGLLMTRVFRIKIANESHRGRLRVEIGRLRKMLRPLAEINSTKHGFVLAPQFDCHVVVLAPPTEEKHAAVLAFLADGELWSSSALALALGTSQRTVQRALESLAEAGRVQSIGRGRRRRWMTSPVPGFTTSLLLPAGLFFD